MLGRNLARKWAGPLHLLAHHNSGWLATVEVLATASWVLHYTWACEDGGEKIYNYVVTE